MISFVFNDLPSDDVIKATATFAEFVTAAAALLTVFFLLEALAFSASLASSSSNFLRY